MLLPITTKFKFCLIAKINGLSAEVKRQRKRLLNSTKTEYKNECYIRKQFVGNEIRHHLLAYALLRGDSYSSVENNCRPDNKPNPKKILQIVHSSILEFEHKYWDIEKINFWLKENVRLTKTRMHYELAKIQ